MPLALEVIELTIDKDMNPFVLVPDRMNAGRKVYDAQLAHKRGQRADCGQPYALAVRTAVPNAVRGALQPLRWDAFVVSRNSAHNKFTSNKLPIVTATFGPLA